MPRVVLAEESKNGLRFEIGPSYDVVPTTFQCPSDWQSSCRHGVIWTQSWDLVKVYVFSTFGNNDEHNTMCTPPLPHFAMEGFTFPKLVVRILWPFQAQVQLF